MRKANRGIITFWVRFACFSCLLVLVLSYAVYVLTPKHDYGICSISNLYRQDKNTIDVLVLGTSLAYSGVNTNVLWKEHGIAAYNLCSAEQPYRISYFYLVEALKTQTPQLILLDAKAATYQREYLGRGRTILSTYGIRSPITRLRAIASCVEKGKIAEFFLAFPQIHANYPAVASNDFSLFPDNGGRGETWKGFIELDGLINISATQALQYPFLSFTAKQEEMNAQESRYAQEIFLLAQSRQIPVLVVCFPVPDYQYDYMYYNTLRQMAADYGFDSVDYNHPTNRLTLNYSKEFSDHQHLNVRGSVVFTRKLAADLLERYQLPDRRSDEAYASYEACAQAWGTQYPQYLIDK